MALEIAKVASPETEGAWLDETERSTVGQMKALVKKHRAGPEQDEESEIEPEESCLLTVTANSEDLWLLECARLLIDEMDGGTTEDVVDALTIEGTTSLLEQIPKRDFDPADLEPASNDAQNAWNRQLERWRAEAEAICEPRIPRWPDGATSVDALGGALGVAVLAGDLEGCTAEQIDTVVRQISVALQVRDFTLGDLAEAFFAADGWRRLGYATARQYASERLGMSLSSLNDKRELVRRLQALPEIRRAYRDGRIGYEAARLVARLATPKTDREWATRAVERTVVHLREDVRAAELLSRARKTEAMVPPEPKVVNDLRALKTEVVTGAVFRDQKSATETSEVAELRQAIADAWNAPPHLRARGRETVRLRVTPEIRQAYRAAERLFLRHRASQVSFLQYACRALIETWAHELPQHEYGHIYARDGLRCANPVCGRRCPTPHHLWFRGRGGSDDDSNVISLCVDCHLHAVHEGYIRVTGTAPDDITWYIGDHTVVKGRTRISMSDR